MTLSTAQIDALLARNPSLALRVAEWDALMYLFTYEQGPAPWLTYEIPIPGQIPQAGLWLNDSVLGIVVVFPDAKGVLRFTTAAAPPPNAEALGSYGVIPVLGGVADFVETIAISAAILAGLWFAWPFLASTRPRTNPRRRRRKNPPGRGRMILSNPGRNVVIGNEVEKIFYRKGQPHACDAECRRSDHRYVHTFERKFPLIGRADGMLEI